MLRVKKAAALGIAEKRRHGGIAGGAALARDKPVGERRRQSGWANLPGRRWAPGGAANAVACWGGWTNGDVWAMPSPPRRGGIFVATVTAASGRKSAGAGASAPRAGRQLKMAAKE
jgi:hypothetical protein